MANTTVANEIDQRLSSALVWDFPLMRRCAAESMWQYKLQRVGLREWRGAAVFFFLLLLLLLLLL